MTPLRLFVLVMIPIVSARLLGRWSTVYRPRFLAKVLWSRRSSLSSGPHRHGWITLPRGGASTAETSIAPALPTSPDGSAIPPQPVTPSTVTTDASLEKDYPAWKRQLPEALRDKGPRTLQKLVLGQSEIYLLGTAHVSNDSSVDVDLLLEAVDPDLIFVELCESRIPLLEGLEPTLNATLEEEELGFWERLRSVQHEHGCSQMQAMGTVMLTSVQADYAKELDVELGGEFRRAYEYWRRRGRQHPYKRCRLILGDRPMHVTVMRAWESLRWFPKIKVILGLLWSSLPFQKPSKEELREWLDAVRREESDVLTESMAELRKHFPTIYMSIIHERDLWLAAKLVQVCRGLQRLPQRSTVVAIVGAGHMPGVIGHLTNGTMSQSPEEVLGDLVMTRRLANDPAMKDAVASWVNDVTELQEMADASFQWARPETPVNGPPPSFNELSPVEASSPSS